MSDLSSTARKSAGKFSSKRIAAAQIIGTTIEWYDFFIYGTASALVFNKVFFPELSPLLGTVLAFTTLGSGLVARPIGAVVFGHMGDRLGRKRALVVTLLMMGGSTVAIGLLPTYASVGVLAQILLFILRIIQGVAVGGEWGGAVLIGVEHALPRRKVLFGSFAQLGSPIALILSTCVFLAVSFGSSESWVNTWGWRIPFLASVLLIPVGFIIRTRIAESPEFERAAAESKKRSVPVIEVFRRNWLQLLIGIGVAAGTFVTYYLFVTFVQAYATSTLGMSKEISLPANLIAAVFEGAAIVVGALVSIRFGGRSVAICGAFALVVWAFPAFTLVNTATPVGLYVAIAGSMVALGIPYGVIAAEIAMLFDPHVRYTGLSVSYNVASALGGGLAPIFAAYSVSTTGSVWGVSVLTAVVALIMVVSCFALPRKGRQVSAEEKSIPSGV